MFRRFSVSPSWIPIGLVAASVAMAFVVSTYLADGWIEIPDHWWWTFAVGGPLGLAGVWFVGRRGSG